MIPFKKHFLFLTFLGLLIHYNAISQSYDLQKSLKGFDQYIEKVMKDWNAPGLAVGIVVKDKLVFAKGYGFRNLEKRLPVTPSTVFAIASNTKLFTSVAAGFLVEEGKLAWDKPIKQFDPTIEFYNGELKFFKLVLK